MLARGAKSALLPKLGLRAGYGAWEGNVRSPCIHWRHFRASDRCTGRPLGGGGLQRPSQRRELPRHFCAGRRDLLGGHGASQRPFRTATNEFVRM